MELAFLAIGLQLTNDKQPIIEKPLYSNVQLLKTNQYQFKNEQEVNKTEKYKIKEGDTLIKIAKKYNTTWQRLFYKNKKITHPDDVKKGIVIVIPSKSEKLKARKVPVRASSIYTTPTYTSSSNTPYKASTSVIQANSAGNTYDYGYCTWFVKNMRPDLPNNLGNAITWLSMAQAQGFSTGSTPKVGAVAWEPISSLGHVAYVIAVNGSSVTVSEMNYGGWGVQTTRETTANSFQYIY